MVDIYRELEKNMYIVFALVFFIQFKESFLEQKSPTTMVNLSEGYQIHVCQILIESLARDKSSTNTPVYVESYHNTCVVLPSIALHLVLALQPKVSRSSHGNHQIQR